MDNALICRKIVSPEKPKPDNSKDTNTYSKTLLRKNSKAVPASGTAFLCPVFSGLLPETAFFVIPTKKESGLGLCGIPGLGA